MPTRNMEGQTIITRNAGYNREIFYGMREKPQDSLRRWKEELGRARKQKEAADKDLGK